MDNLYKTNNILIESGASTQPGVSGSDTQSKTNNMKEFTKNLGITSKERQVFSFKEAKKKGLKLAFIRGNRNVYVQQINKLYKSVKGHKKFSNNTICVLAKEILEKYEDIKLYDRENKPIYLTSPDIDSHVVVLDGQHRLMVCILHPEEVDVDIELIECDENPLEKIKILNSFDKNWNNNDLKHHNKNTGKSTTQLYEEAQKIVDEFNVSTKYAEFILTFDEDASKKKDLLAGLDNMSYDEGTDQRGKSILYATMFQFNEAKEMKKVQWIKAILAAYKATSDSEKGMFGKEMKNFLCSLDESMCNNIKELLHIQNYGELNKTIVDEFKKFRKNFKDIIDELDIENEEKINNHFKAIKEKAQEKGDIKVLKYGLPSDIIRNREEIAKKKAEAASEKKQKKTSSLPKTDDSNN